MSDVKYHPELDGPRPPCFTPEQWTIHVRCEKNMARAGYEPNPSGFCAECTMRHKYQMMELGKCSHPDVVFVTDEDGALNGRRPTKDLHITK